MSALFALTGLTGWDTTAAAQPTVRPTAVRPTAATKPAELRVTGRFFSAPPDVLAATRSSTTSEEPEPDPGPPPTAPTRGTVTGRVVQPDGKPLAGSLVVGIRFSDLGSGIDFEEESAVQARTGADGRFTLRQLTERYLIRVCDAADEAFECSEDPEEKRFAPTWVGPDGVSDSWLTHTRMFRPRQPGRALGTIKARPSAQLQGTFTGGANQTVRLLRANDTVAARAFTDEDGRYGFEVAPGRYRVEVDRIPGVRTFATRPGYRSGLVRLTTRRTTTLNFSSSPGASVYGRVTVHGEPLVEQFLAITDPRNRFALGVVTDEDGRFSVDALKPGRYTLSTPPAITPYQPASRTVDLTLGSPIRADLELVPGASITLAPIDPVSTDPDRPIGIELRNAAGQISKAVGAVTKETVSFSGLAPGRYQIVARRSADDGSGEVVTDLPWAERIVDVTGTNTVTLGAVPLDHSTLNLSGSIPRGSRIRITPIPDVPYLRDAYTAGTGVTALSQNWVEPADASGRYLSRGLVPGRYFVAITTQLVESNTAPTVYRGNVATTWSRLTVTASTRTADFTAPRGGRVTGQVRYASNHRPAIAPIGFEVRDCGPQAYLFPLLSRPQTFGSGFVVDRLHAGRAKGAVVDISQALDVADLRQEEPPTNLLDSAHLTDDATPYWLESRTRSFKIKSGKATDLGSVTVYLRK